MKKNILKYLLEGVILSLLCLALMGVTNQKGDDGLYICYDFEDGLINSVTWPIITTAYSFAISFFLLKFKKYSRRFSLKMALVFMLCPTIIDLCFRGDTVLLYDSIVWIFLIIILVWFLIRYEYNEIFNQRK